MSTYSKFADKDDTNNDKNNAMKVYFMYELLKVGKIR
jgi:hypothetical protein